MADPSPAPRLPKYRHYKPKNLAVVRIEGKDHYLGPYCSEESREKYRRLVAAWLAGLPRGDEGRRGPQPPASDLAIVELLVAYLRFADGYYVKNGRPTSEPTNIRLALRPLRDLYGMTLMREFGPRALKVVRQAIIDADLCRNEVNKRIRRIVRVFKWGVENELVPPEVHHGLKAVSGLRAGRSEARERCPVRPVADGLVEAVRPNVSRQVWAMIELQRLTGMRPGEVVLMRVDDLDTSGPIWTYTPHSHKTEYHGHGRVVYLGPRAQEVLRPWLRADRLAYHFSPREALEEHWRTRRDARATPMTPSQRARSRKVRRSRPIGEHYTTMSYVHAIAQGCKNAGINRWHAHQLRHTAATRLRKEFGVDAARVILGHRSPVVTEVYAELDHEKALAVMGRVG
ncbi:tyrosine-type recombinase/integrase [Tautonia plasticadhaerens]|uniref:Site-specific tyrosine recombinase XerC n=1 Tax=Tautonia plasticadhaerens TaxID=2527974 RepID=A0A518GXW6_9BACT|nr:tyrosine-type recombinase/integrase [Tautonia plasticadhaerens]QDV33444.1 site-specific tyrosine recombinase XerC [Tautonia plasticadhaerens]